MQLMNSFAICQEYFSHYTSVRHIFIKMLQHFKECELAQKLPFEWWWHSVLEIQPIKAWIYINELLSVLAFMSPENEENVKSEVKGITDERLIFMLTLNLMMVLGLWLNKQCFISLCPACQKLPIFPTNHWLNMHQTCYLAGKPVCWLDSKCGGYSDKQT